MRYGPLEKVLALPGRWTVGGVPARKASARCAARSSFFREQGAMRLSA
jgi:hypothetical protein